MSQRVPIPHLTALRGFEAGARLGSFNAAAAELGLTASAVSHQVKTLEIDLGLALFIRRNRKIELTEAGRTLQAYVSRAFDELHRGAAAVRETAGAAVIRVSVAPSFAAAYFTHRIDEFERLNPGLILELDVSQALANLDIEPFDAAIRLGPTAASDLFSEVIAEGRMAPACTPALAMHIKTPEDLAKFPRISFRQAPDAWKTWGLAVGIADLPCRRELWFDTFIAAHQAAMAGEGVMMASVDLVLDSSATGNLSLPFEIYVRSSSTYRLICRRGEENLPKIARLRRWVKGLKGGK